MRRVLDTLYQTSLVAACLAMVAIAGLVLVQIVGRLLDRALVQLGLETVGLTVPSLAEIGGFLFVGAACLALPATFRAGGHIRVTLLRGAMSESIARWATRIVLAAALGLALFATWHSYEQAADSWTFASVSYGMIRIPLWIPQAVMTLGFGLLALAIGDELVTSLRGQDPAFDQAEKAQSGSGH